MKATSTFFILLASALLMAQASSYHVTHTYTLGGDGSWDYVVPDPPNHRLFIARQNRVMVVDEDKGTLLGEVIGINGAHGTAIAGSSGHGFATAGNDQAVIMFDAKTFKSLKRIPAAEDADAIIYDAPSDRVFTLNGDAHSSTVIDSSGNLVTNIPLGGKPEYGASAGDGRLYANLTDTSEVVEIDSKTAKVARRWSTAACASSPCRWRSTRRIIAFSAAAGSGVMAVSDYQAGRVAATVPIGMGVDGAGYDPASGNAFASNIDGTLTVVHQDSPDKYRVVQTVETPRGVA